MQVSSDMRFFSCLFRSFSFIVIFFYHSCHKNNCLSRKDESFFNNRGQKIVTGAPNGKFRENICSEDDLRTRIFGTFVVKFLACLPLLGFSNIYKMEN